MNQQPLLIDHPDLRLPASRMLAVRCLRWEQNRIGECPDERDLFVSLQYCAMKANSPLSYGSKYRWTIFYRRLFALIAEQNIGLPYSMIERYFKDDTDVDELQSEAMLALYRCIRCFNPWSGYRFSTYACNGIYRVCARFRTERLRRFGKFKNVFNEKLDACPDDHRPEDPRIDGLRHVLEINAARLTDVEQYVIRQRFPLDSGMRGPTLKVLGDRFGLSRERMRQIQVQALEKIRLTL